MGVCKLKEPAEKCFFCIWREFVVVMLERCWVVVILKRELVLKSLCVRNMVTNLYVNIFEN